MQFHSFPFAFPPSIRSRLPRRHTSFSIPFGTNGFATQQESKKNNNNKESADSARKTRLVNGATNRFHGQTDEPQTTVHYDPLLSNLWSIEVEINILLLFLLLPFQLRGLIYGKCAKKRNNGKITHSRCAATRAPGKRETTHFEMDRKQSRQRR